jgi:RNA polymerase sigma-70 factor (ECF subfamily)
VADKAAPGSDTPSGQPAPPRAGQLTSVSLLARARTRDEQAWQQVVDLYQPLVLARCARRGVPAQDAEDIAQEVFTAAARGLSGFRRDRPGDTFRGWLRGITHNHILLYFRRNRDRVAGQGGSDALEQLHGIADPLAAAPEEDPAEADALYRRAVEQVRGSFEERTWQAFWRTAIEELPVAAVAEEMGMSQPAVRQAKSRVLRCLKAQLGELLG